MAAEIERIVTSRAVRCLYQPIVDLESRETVGYEGLSRGPAGSPLERPDHLFAAAREAGLLAELDALCQETALETAMAQGLAHPYWLFINTEPETMDRTIPRLLETYQSRGRPLLPIVVEVTERSITRRPAELLHSLERLRRLGARIAVDDAGADVRSLALMPLLRPAVIKLDLRLVQEQPSRTVAQIMTAVSAEAERSGAIVLAEGIETEEHLQVARSLGATLGQGWLFGRPGALPVDRPGRPRGRLEAAPHPRRAPTAFELCADGRETRIGRKALLIELSKHLEAQALEIGPMGVLFSTFQEARNFTPATEVRYRSLAEQMSLVAALGEGLDAEPVEGVRGAVLHPDDPVRGEWDVIVVGPQFAAALVARDLGDDGPDRDRRFEFVMTYERDVVVEAARSLMTRLWGDVPEGMDGAAPRTAFEHAGPSPLSSPSSLHLRALAAARNGVTIVDVRADDQPVVYANEGFERMTGYRASEIVGRNCRFLQGADSDPAAVGQMRDAVEAGTHTQVRVMNHRADGTPFWNELTLSPVHDADGHLTHFIGIQNDVTAEVKAQERLQHLVSHDELTGLPNRRALKEELANALGRGRSQGVGTAVLFVDLDGFKQVNDEGGHQRGDELLRRVGDRLKKLVRASDLVARQHGDEFVIVLADLDGNAARTAARVADQAVAALGEPWTIEDCTVRIGASVGVALAPADADEAEVLLRAADTAMYAAKDAGKGTVVFASTGGMTAGAGPRDGAPAGAAHDEQGAART